MAKLNNGLPIIGSFGEFSIYKMKGVTNLVVRKKGGASREKIKRSPNFALTRRYNSEWAGCSKAGKNIRLAMNPLLRLADYNISGVLNGLCKTIQKADTIGRLGERSVWLSKYCHSLEGFNLNRGRSFDSIIRQPIGSVLSREELRASLQLPALIPGLNFYVPDPFPVFRIIAVLGVLPDMVYTPFGYMPANKETKLWHDSLDTGWSPSSSSFPEQTLSLQLPMDIGLDRHSSLVVSIGIEFGMPLTVDVATPIKGTGAAKILALV